MLHEKLKPKFSSLKFICILFAILILNACRKTDFQTTNYVSEQTKKEVVTKFLTLPDDAPAYLQRIVVDIKKAETKTPFLYELVKAYGIPVWQNTIGKTGDATTQTLNRFNGEVNINAVKTSGVTISQADTSKGKFFIPLKDTNTNEITSFISCEKHNDTLYTYTVYNKQNILNTPLVGDSAKIYAKAELAFFAYFEKTINAKTHSSFTGLQTNYQFNNVNINFNVSPNMATTNTRTSNVKQPENAINIVLADPCYRLLYLYSIDYGNGDIEYYFTVTTCPTLPDVTVISTPRGGGGSNSGSTPGQGGTPAPPGNGMPVTAPGGGGGNSGGGPGGGNAPGDPYNPIILPWPPNWGIGNPYTPPATVIADPNGNTNFSDYNRTDIDYETGDYNNNKQGNEDNTIYSDYDDQTQPWLTIQNVISVSDFVGWDRTLHPNWQCMNYAKAQIAKKGYGISDYYKPGTTNVISDQTIQVYTTTSGVDKNATKNGIGYLLSALQRGIPVIVGVDDQPGSPNQGTDKTTDHFIVIVGSGSDTNGLYFVFYDNASGNVSEGTSSINKLYYNSSTGIISGKSGASYYFNNIATHDYIVAMIRKSKPL
ncbi:MAG: hypothetical protein JST07_00575 [Bacteroidetes bacterium]|nr:hypothetical protein [Bacteroidota bacterium]